MFTIQYWHESAAEWRGTGSGTFYDLSQAKQRQRKLAEMSNHKVRLRVSPT